MMARIRLIGIWWLCCVGMSVSAHAEDQTVRVFVFAGQSNMVGSDSKADDVKRFPPFVGCEEAQPKVRFSYCLGREDKKRSKGWVDLQPVDGVVGPELSFARRLSEKIEAPIAIIKIAAGGTHLGGDWNPDDPQGFQMYPLALEHIRQSLADFERRGIDYRIEGLMWHQGENDMFNEEYMRDYGKNLANFLKSWRRDLELPELRFYVGELCTKTIWGMDLRPRMYAISLGQKSVTGSDELADYVPTSHVGVEIGNPVGLHYHYGTLGQLEHGYNYAEAYLKMIGVVEPVQRSLKKWPLDKGSTVKLFVMAGHRNMEGERAFVQQLRQLKPLLVEDNHGVPFKYSVGGDFRQSQGWEPLGLIGYYDTFGPELSFADTLQKKGVENFAIAKFTHSGSQLIDWTPEGSMAKTRNLYPRFVEFIRESIQELEAKGHEVELEAIVYHVGENEMSMPPYRKQVPEWLKQLVEQTRRDLRHPELRWIVSQQPPTDHESVNEIDVTAGLEALAQNDEFLEHVQVFDLPEQEKRLVIDSAGILHLGTRMADAVVSDE